MKNKVENLRKQPLSFVFRQIFRVFVILPFIAVVHLIELLTSEKTETKGGVCFIISSVIYPSSNKLSYGIRSLFSPEDRVEQTKETIMSIRRVYKDAVIALVEGGLREVPELGSMVDHYIYKGSSRFVRMACGSKYKSLGESVLLLSATRNIPKKFGRYFKISGRYIIGEKFQKGSWNNEFNGYFIRPDFMSTRLYSFDGKFFHDWKFALIKGLPYTFLDYPVEYTLPKFIPKELVHKNDRIGLWGRDGVTGDRIED